MVSAAPKRRPGKRETPSFVQTKIIKFPNNSKGSVVVSVKSKCIRLFASDCIKSCRGCDFCGIKSLSCRDKEKWL